MIDLLVAPLCKRVADSGWTEAMADLPTVHSYDQTQPKQPKQ